MIVLQDSWKEEGRRFRANKNPASCEAGILPLPGLGAGDGRCGETFLVLHDLEGDGVADLEFIVRHADELLGVEEEILLLSFDGDESESTIRERLDSTGHDGSLMCCLW